MNGWNLGNAVADAIIGMIILAFFVGALACGLAIGSYHVIAWLLGL